MPTAPDTDIAGVGTVFQQGGDYIGTGPASGSYSILDNALSQTLNSASALGRLARGHRGNRIGSTPPSTAVPAKCAPSVA
ncbi:hypothetical protein NHF46_21545 [Arthrobacter alpinus]|nr:hypothetical protein [Arthrobacter alpinus]